MNTPATLTGAGWAAFLAALTGRSLIVAVLLAAGVAALLSLLFETSFAVLLGRTLFIAMVLLLASTGRRSDPFRGLWPGTRDRSDDRAVFKADRRRGRI